MRADLRTWTAETAGSDRVTIKDPIALRYHRLREDEWFVLQQMKRTADLESIREAYERKFAPRRVSLAQIQALLFRFHRSELVVSHTAGQADAYGRRSRKQRRQKWLSSLQGVLFIRFPGIDPEPLLRVLYPWIRPFLRPALLVLSGLICVAALILFATHADGFFAESPSLSQIFQPQTLLGLAMVLSVTKILHELGHAIACKHFGGECHEIGPMLLVFTPALYCDTSDSWMLTSRWQRATVGAAGMGVECFLAAIATFVWWYSNPGFVHHAAMNVMLVCSISTLLFNGNPLLRYDGYYILADLCDTPNLAARSREHFKRLAASWLLGIPPRPGLTVSDRASGWLLAYQLAAFVYRWTITIAILWFVTQFLRPYGFQSIGWTIALLALIPILLMPVFQAVKFLSVPGNMNRIRIHNVVIASGCCAGLIGAGFFPVTHHVVGPARVVPRDPQPVYVTMGGFRPRDQELGPSLEGRVVREGETLMVLRNDDLQREYLQALERKDSQELLLAQLQRTSHNDPEAAGQIPFATAALEDLRQRLAKLDGRRKALTVTAPTDGVVVRAQPLPAPASSGQLAGLTGLPTANQNAGAYLQTGTPLCSIAVPGRFDAVLMVSQADIDYVRVGQRVMVVLDALTSQPIEGIVTEIGQENARALEAEAPTGTEQGDGAAGRIGPAGAAPPADYPVRVQLRTGELPLVYHQQGRAKVLIGNHPLAKRLYRTLAGLFRFQ